MSTREDRLKAVRDRIDAIDRELQKLLNERAACALEVGEIKQADPDSEAPVFYRPEREAQILSRLKQENQGPLSDDDIAARLKEEGLSIARRTVTKYRKMLGIPSSRQRKVFE